MPENCTCWWGSYAKIGGGTGFDIARYDPECPEHCSDDKDDNDAEA